MGSGLSVRNESDCPILIICSQVGPLYWGKADIGQTWNHNNSEANIGKVWFTVSAMIFDPANEVNFVTVSGKFPYVTAPVPVANLAFGLITMSVANGLTSVVGVKKDGVYADGKCLVVRGMKHSDGVYELYFAVSEESLVF